MTSNDQRSPFQIIGMIVAAILFSIFLVTCVLPVASITGLSCLGSHLDEKFEQTAQ